MSQKEGADLNPENKKGLSIPSYSIMTHSGLLHIQTKHQIAQTIVVFSSGAPHAILTKT